MGQRITQVDAFTDHRFSGNPAAVCVLSDPAEDRWMQDVAAEINLSETAFVRRRETGSMFHLRWFTPNSEVDLCGHATLATANVLWERASPRGPRGSIRDPERPLDGAARPGRHRTRFPLRTGRCGNRDRRGMERACTAISAPIRFAGRNRFDLLVVLDREEEVRSLVPDIRRLEQLPVRGVIVTSRSDSKEYDFVSRFFAPRVGVNEDPVCGSAHCCLGPYWRDKWPIATDRPPGLPTWGCRQSPRRSSRVL